MTILFTTDQSPDEAEGSLVRVMYMQQRILELCRSIKQRMFVARYGTDLFLIVRIPFESHNCLDQSTVAPHLVALTP